MNVHPVVAGKAPGEQISKNAGKMAFRWSQGLSGYRLPFCQHNGCFMSPCAQRSVGCARMRSVGSGPTETRQAPRALQSRGAPPRPQGVPGFHELPGLVLLGHVEIPLWQPFLPLVCLSRRELRRAWLEAAGASL